MINMDINERLDKLKQEKSFYEDKLKKGVELYMNMYIPDIIIELNIRTIKLTQKLREKKFEKILKKKNEPNTK